MALKSQGTDCALGLPAPEPSRPLLQDLCSCAIYDWPQLDLLVGSSRTVGDSWPGPGQQTQPTEADAEIWTTGVAELRSALGIPEGGLMRVLCNIY